MLIKKYKIIIVLLLISGLYFVSSGILKNESVVTVGVAELAMIIDGPPINFSFDIGQSLYEILLDAQNDKKLKFSGKNYPALGFFVTDIESLHSGDDKNLIYYINGQEANVGVSAYFPQNGDVVEWKLK